MYFIISEGIARPLQAATDVNGSPSPNSFALRVLGKARRRFPRMAHSELPKRESWYGADPRARTDAIARFANERLRKNETRPLLHQMGKDMSAFERRAPTAWRGRAERAGIGLCLTQP